jgi:hypothetical protein
MSAPRRLWVRLRTVDRQNRDTYRAAVRQASDAAAESGAHFWGFEVDGGEGRFIEFLEGPDDGVLTRLDERTSDVLGAAAGNGGAEGAWLEAEGLRCTELTDG